MPGAGTFSCHGCGSQLSLQEDDRLTECPRCGGATFHRDSIFEPMQEHPVTVEFSTPAPLLPPSWLRRVRAELPAGRFLVYRGDDEEIRSYELGEGWTRIGRSVAADIRLDDPSVSRRHALVVSEGNELLRILDDRSLNGVFVNGELVEWGRLGDGDEVTIGRYHLYLLEA
jgi:hypothetical protein